MDKQVIILAMAGTKNLSRNASIFGIIKSDEADRIAPNEPVSLIALNLTRGDDQKQWFIDLCATNK